MRCLDDCHTRQAEALTDGCGQYLPPADFQVQVLATLADLSVRLAAIEDAIGVSSESAGQEKRHGDGKPPPETSISKPGGEVASSAEAGGRQPPQRPHTLEGGTPQHASLQAAPGTSPSPRSEASLGGKRSGISEPASDLAAPFALCTQDRECIQLEASMWDASLLIGLVHEEAGEKALTPLTSVLIAVSNAVNVAMQMAFILAITTTMSKTPFDAPSQSSMLKKRLLAGHSIMNLDHSSASTRTSMLCAGTAHDMLGETWGAVSDYIPQAGQWPPAVPGVVIALMGMFIWVARMTVELRRTVDVFLAILYLPSGARLVRGSSIVSMPPSHKLLLTLLVTGPRLLIDLALLFFGLEYLAFTPDVGDIILNACALEIVDSIDEFVFEVVASKYVFSLMEQTSISVSLSEPGFCNLKPETVEDTKGRRACWMIGRATFVIGALCTGWFWFLTPFLAQVHEVRHIICGKSHSFVYLIHPTTNLPVFSETEIMESHNLCFHAAFDELLRIRAGFLPLYAPRSADAELFERVVQSDLGIVRSEELQRMSDASYYASDLCRDQDVTLEVVRQTCLNFTVFGAEAGFLADFGSCADLGQACRCPSNGLDAVSGHCSDAALQEKAQENEWHPEWMYILRAVCPQTCDLC